MYALVSLLNQPHFDRVFKIWRDLEARFGLRYVLDTTPLPHLTWQVAEDYDLPALVDGLDCLTKRMEPMTARVDGLGLFSGEAPTVYLKVVPSPRLAALHRQLFDLTLPMSTDLGPYYQPANWVPHITLASMHELTPTVLPKVVNYLEQESYRWRIRIESVSLLCLQASGRAHETERFGFGEGLIRSSTCE